MHEIATLDLLGLWIAAVLTLFVFSFLYKDNPLYKFAEHLFVGVSAGYILVRTWNDVLVPMLFQRIWIPGRDLTLESAMVFIPAALAVMMLLRLVPRAAWISRWPLAFMMGVTSGLFVIMFLQTNAIQQVRATMVSFVVNPGDWLHVLTHLLPFVVLLVGIAAAMIIMRERVEFLYRKWNVVFPAYLAAAGAIMLWAIAVRTNAAGDSLLANESLNNVLLFTGVTSGLVYFFFSKAHTGAFGMTAKVGIYFLMVAFGASFGYTIMARISLLIGRSQYLIDEWMKGAVAQTPVWVSVLIFVALGGIAVAALGNWRRAQDIPRGPSSPDLDPPPGGEHTADEWDEEQRKKVAGGR